VFSGLTGGIKAEPIVPQHNNYLVAHPLFELICTVGQDSPGVKEPQSWLDITASGSTGSARSVLHMFRPCAC